jgi:hypothetical protein
MSATSAVEAERETNFLLAHDEPAAARHGNRERVGG